MGNATGAQAHRWHSLHLTELSILSIFSLTNKPLQWGHENRNGDTRSGERSLLLEPDMTKCPFVCAIFRASLKGVDPSVSTDRANLGLEALQRKGVCRSLMKRLSARGLTEDHENGRV